MFEEARLKSPEVLMEAYRTTMSNRGSYWLAYVLLGEGVFPVSACKVSCECLKRLASSLPRYSLRHDAR